MLPIELEITNFTSYKHEIIHFNEFGSPVIITGDNGNGKSSIIDMITTALYFRARCTDSRGSGIDDLISKHEKEMNIRFVFEMDNNTYTINRTKKRDSTHTLSFGINGIDQSSSIKETQQKILDTIKIDYDTFLDTVCIAQGNSGSFMNKSPDERKEIFAQILNLNEYESLEKQAKELKKQANNQLDNLNLKMDEYTHILSFKDDYTDKLNTYKAEYNSIDTSSLEQQLEAITKEKIQYESMKSKNQMIKNQRMHLKASIEKYNLNIHNAMQKTASLKDSIIDTSESNKKLENMSNELDTIKKNINSLQVNIGEKKSIVSLINKELKEISNKIKAIEEYNQATCEFCGNELTDEYKKQYIIELKQKGNDKFSQGKAAKKEYEEYSDKLSTLQMKEKELHKNITDIEHQLTNNQIVDNKLKALADTLESNREELETSKKLYDENMQMNIDDIEDKTFDDISIKHKIQELQSKREEYASKIAILTDRLEKIHIAEIDSAALKDEIINAETLVDDYKSLSVAFGKSGIQSFIIENTLPAIEAEINELLETLTDGTINIQFIMQKQTKNKKSNIDTLDIIVNDSGISRKYETYSGGEKFRIDFACHVGLARFLTKRAEASIDMFILDENLGSQDDTAKTIFVKCINKLTKYFKQIIIITHIDDIKNAFDNRVIVTKDKVLGSKVEKLGGIFK